VDITDRVADAKAAAFPPPLPTCDIVLFKSKKSDGKNVEEPKN
jgi:hypothetical protein